MTSQDHSASPFPQNLTEKVTRPRHAFDLEKAMAKFNRFYETLERPSYKDRHNPEYWKRQFTYWGDRVSRASEYDPYTPHELEFFQQLVSDKWFDTQQMWDKKEQEDRNKRAFAEKEKEELGPREFTFTYSDSWYTDDKQAQHAMETAIDRLIRYYKHEIKDFHAVGEFTKAGRSHIHGYYLLEGGRKITDKNFKRAWPHWNPKKKLGKGFEGGHHASITRYSDFAGYTEKHLDEAWLSIHITNDADDHTPTIGSRTPPQLPQDGWTFDPKATLE